MEPFPIPEDYDEIDLLSRREDLSLCWSHYMCEPWSPEAYRTCGECGHVFVTAEELLRDHNSVLVELASWQGQEVDADNVWHCPHCVHDF